MAAHVLQVLKLIFCAGSHNDVNLEQFGHCNFISPDHACIVLDLVNELIFCAGSHNDVNLEQFGHCNFISPDHACIVLDQVNKLNLHDFCIDNLRVLSLYGLSDDIDNLALWYSSLRVVMCAL